LTGAHDIGVWRNARLTADFSITPDAALDGCPARAIRGSIEAMRRIALHGNGCNG